MEMFHSYMLVYRTVCVNPVQKAMLFSSPAPFLVRFCSICPGCGTAPVLLSSLRQRCFCSPRCSTGARGACGRGQLGDDGISKGSWGWWEFTPGKSWKTMGNHVKSQASLVFSGILVAFEDFRYVQVFSNQKNLLMTNRQARPEPKRSPVFTAVGTIFCMTSTTNGI